MSDPRTLWSQNQESFTMSLAELHTHAARFQRRIHLRNAIEYAAGAIVVLAFGLTAWVAPSLMGKIGAGMIAAGAFYVCWRLHVQARAASGIDALQSTNCSEFHRGELVRQRDALASVWRWYLGPLVPGLIVFWLSAGLNADTTLLRFGVPLLGLGVTAVVFTGIAGLNAQAAKTLQAEIDALDAAR